MPTIATGSPSGAPAAARCSCVSEAASIVRIPIRSLGGSSDASQGSWSRAELMTVAEAASWSSRWKRAQYPQLVVMTETPAASSSRAPARTGSNSARLPSSRIALDPRAGEYPEQDRPRPGGRVAHVARDAWHSDVEHQDAEGHAVEIAAARHDEIGIAGDRPGPTHAETSGADPSTSCSPLTRRKPA